MLNFRKINNRLSFVLVPQAHTILTILQDQMAAEILFLSVILQTFLQLLMKQVFNVLQKICWMYTSYILQTGSGIVIVL